MSRPLPRSEKSGVSAEYIHLRGETRGDALIRISSIVAIRSEDNYPDKAVIITMEAVREPIVIGFYSQEPRDAFYKTVLGFLSERQGVASIRFQANLAEDDETSQSDGKADS